MQMVMFKDPDPHGGFSGQEGGEGVGVHRRRSLGWGNVTRCEQNRKTSSRSPEIYRESAMEKVIFSKLAVLLNLNLAWVCCSLI